MASFRTHSYLLIITLTLLSCSHGKNLELALSASQELVFISGNDNYECFRIPAIVSLANGDLLAFAEGRKNGCSDTGSIDLVMKRSNDLGVTWGDLEVIWSDSLNTCGNPAPVVDRNTGKVHLLSTWNLGSDHESDIINGTSTDTRRVFHMVSSDDGKTWSSPREITKDVKLPNWTWYATGPGSGIQLTQTNAGRLMVACDHIEANSRKYYSHVIFSDDGGDHWILGGSSPKDQVNECEVAENVDGTLLLNMRNYDPKHRYRQTAISTDGGLSWTNQKFDNELREPICQASLQVLSKEESILLFSNPASKSDRIAMTLRVSMDFGATWSDSVVIHQGPAAYSDLVVDENNQIGCLYEAGLESAYESIRYANIAVIER